MTQRDDMIKTIGEFEIEIWEDGWPIQCHLKVDSKEIRFNSDSLYDLRHAVNEMIRLAEEETK